MNPKRIVWRLALGAALLVGCDRQDDPANTPATPAPPTPDMTPKAGGPSDAADATAGAGTSSPGAAAGDMPGDEAASTTSTPEPKAPGSVEGAGSSSADVAADGASDDPVKAKEAQEYLSQTAQHLSDQKPDLARASLEKAEAMEDSLPKTLREEIKTMRKNVDSMSKPQDLPVLTDDDNK